MTLRLVAANTQHLNALVQMDREAGPHPWSPSALKHHLKTDQVWLLSARQQTLGFLAEQVVLDEATLLHLVIARHHQGQGWATKALAHWLRTKQQQQVVRVFLEVRHSNRVAMSVYQHLGFTHLATRSGYYQDKAGTEDALVMQKTLDSSCDILL